jgi:hypothetical protein
MKTPLALAAALALSLTAIAAPAQQGPAPQVNGPALGEVMVSSNRQSTRYYQQDRPVVGLRRRADAAVMWFSVTSDTREEPTRRQEIHTVLLGAIDRAAASGFEIVSGNGQLQPVTRENYKSLPIEWAGRVDTGKVNVMVRAKLTGSAEEVQGRLSAFVRSLSKTGRATVETGGAITLTVINPDQYRDQIVSLVAQDAKHNAALFGPEFTFSLTGIDGQVAWSQVSSTDVFLFIPYRYSIVPK